MVRIKNIRAGVVILPGHRLRLAPGAVASVDRLTPEIERAVAAGLVVTLDAPVEKIPEREPAPREEVGAPKAGNSPDREPEQESPVMPDSPIEDLAKISQAEAIPQIAQERDSKRLRALLSLDKRPRIQDAIRRRLSEIEAVGPR